MPEGFKLLDAYVEVKADATGIGEKVSKAFTAEVTPAAKKMADAVETATQRVAAASKRQADAAASLRLAQMRLADIEKTGSAGATQLAAAQERVAAATRNVAAADYSAERSAKALATAQEQATSGARTRIVSNGELAGASMGNGFLSGFKGTIGGGVVGGIVGGITNQAMYQVQNVIGAGFMAAKGAVVDFNSQLENSTIGFTTMLGSAQKAQVFLGQLQDFAKTTPFEFGNLVQNAQQMMGMGIAAKDVIPDLTALGDSVASIGGSAQQVNQVTLAFDQMAAKGTLDMGNMTQILQGGVPSALKILAAGFHTTTGDMIKMISSGKVLSSEALPLLVKGIEHGTKSTAALGGMMDKQSATFTGAMSNISDALNQGIAKGFQPFFKILEHGAINVANFVSTKPFQKWVGNIGRIFTDAVKKVEGFVHGLESAFAPPRLAKLDPSKTVDHWVKHMVGTLNDPKLNPPKTVAGWVKHLDAIPKPKNPFDKVMGDVRTSMTKTQKPLKTLTDGFKGFAKDTLPSVVKILDDLVVLLPQVTQFLADISPVLKPLAQVLNFVVKFGLDPVLNRLSKLLGALHDLQDPIKLTKDVADGALGPKGMSGILLNNLDIVKGWVGGIVGFFNQVNDTVGSISRDIVGTFMGLPDSIASVPGQIVSGLVGGLTGLWPGVLDKISSLVNAIPLVVRKLLGIASPSKVFHLIGQQVGQGLHLGLLGSVDQIKQTSINMVDAIKSGFTGSGVSAAVRIINADTKVLERLSARRQHATDRLKNAEQALATIYGNRHGFADNVRSGVTGLGNVAGIFSQSPAVQAAAAGTLNGRAYQPSWTHTSHAGLGAVRASLRKLVVDTRAFRWNLAELARRGIDPATYDQLVQAGVQGGGLETARALVSDPSMARNIFGLERQVDRAGAALGWQTAKHEYAGQVRHARATVLADQRAVNRIEVTMVVEAKKIDEVQKLIRMVDDIRAVSRKKGKK